MMDIIVFNLIYVSIFIGLIFAKKISILYGFLSILIVIALDLFILNPYLGFSIPVIFIFLIPFLNNENNYERSDTIEIPQTDEGLEYKLNFKDFTSNYLDILKREFKFKGAVIYKKKITHFKLTKAYPLSNFHFIQNTINLNSPILIALKQFNNDIKLTTDDQIISNLIQVDYPKKLQTRTYYYGEYLITIFGENPLEDELRDNINNFLKYFRYIGTKLDEQKYKKYLLDLSQKLNEVINKEDVENIFLKILKDYLEFDTAIFTLKKDDKHIVKRILEVTSVKNSQNNTIDLEEDDFDKKYVIKDNLKLKKYENYNIESKKSLLNIVLENQHYAPSKGLYDPERNYLFGEKDIFDRYRSLITFPIKERDEAVGTLSLLSYEYGQFNTDSQSIKDIKTLFNMLDISLFNSRIYRKLEEMATTDGLTGLINHRTFQVKLNEYLERAKRSSSKVAVVLTDIDHFKSVNDSYGHPVGDEVLRRVAKILKKSVRSVDLVARYGGEEFVIIVENTDKDSVYKLTNRIREDIKSEEFISNNRPFKVTISMGFSIFPNSSEDKQELIDIADKALYYSKENGRDQVNYIEDIKEGV